MREATARQTLRDYDTRRLEVHYPNTTQILVAIRLAKDLETCAALLQGHPVDPTRIDKDALARALETSLVQLVRPIDVLTAA